MIRHKLCEQCSRQMQPQVQRSWGKCDLGLFEEQQRGQAVGVLLGREVGDMHRDGSRLRLNKALAALARSRVYSKGVGEPMEGLVQGVTWLEFQFSKLPLGAGCRGGMADHWGEAGMSK